MGITKRNGALTQTVNESLACRKLGVDNLLLVLRSLADKHSMSTLLGSAWTVVENNSRKRCGQRSIPIPTGLDAEEVGLVVPLIPKSINGSVPSSHHPPSPDLPIVGPVRARHISFCRFGVNPHQSRPWHCNGREHPHRENYRDYVVSLPHSAWNIVDSECRTPVTTMLRRNEGRP